MRLGFFLLRGTKPSVVASAVAVVGIVSPVPTAAAVGVTVAASEGVGVAKRGVMAPGVMVPGVVVPGVVEVEPQEAGTPVVVVAVDSSVAVAVFEVLELVFIVTDVLFVPVTCGVLMVLESHLIRLGWQQHLAREECRLNVTVCRRSGQP